MRRVIVLSMMFVAAFSAQARAGLVVYLQDTSVPNSGYGVMNIWLGSTDPAADGFNNYSVQLQITGPNFLEFAPNPAMPSTATPETQNYSYLSANNYIFNQGGSDSLFGLTDTNGGAPISGTNNTQFLIFDQSLSLSSYSSPNNTPGSTLLASLVLFAAVTNPGDSYAVSVVSGANTFFNTNFDPTTNVSYSVGSANGYNGLATIGSAAVPEPASFVLGLTGLAFVAGLAGFGRFRQK